MTRTTHARRTTGLIIVAALAAFLALGCDREPDITTEQAEEAFMVAFGGAYVGSMAVQFGQTLPGVTLDMENNAVIYEEFDVSDLETDYTTLSGTVTTTDESASADFALTGGPVQTISFDINADQMSAEDGISATVTVNGREMDIGIAPPSGN